MESRSRTSRTTSTSDVELLFTNGDPEKTFAWNAYYLTPGLKSAWLSLGYPLPDADQTATGK